MGKGNRNNKKRAAEQINNSEKLFDKQKNVNKKKSGDRAVAIACIVFAVLIAASLAVNVMQENGVFIRQEKAANTDNFEVDAAMMGFFYNEYLMNWYEENYSYLSYYSIDLSSNLRTQTYGGGYEVYFLGAYDGTWYDYFLDKVLEEIDMYLEYAEGAKAAGLSLSDEDYEEIDTIIDGIKATLKANRVKYSDWYGRGVKEKDIRRCYELILLASNFADYKVEKLEEALDEDDAALLKYVDEHKATFYTAEYLSYQIKLSSKNFDTDEAYDAAVEAAKAAAEKIAEAKTPAEFVEFVDAYKTENNIVDDEKSESETGTETLTPEEELEAKLEKLKGEISYETSSDLGKWIFGEEVEVNDTKVIDKTGTETEAKEDETEEEGESGNETEAKKTYDTYTVTAYMLTSPSSRDTSLTKDAAFLIASDKAEVEKFIAAFKAGETNRENFIEVANKQAEALHAGHDHEEEGFVEPTFSYDSFEKMTDNYFTDAYGKLNDWLDTGDREANTISDIMEIVIKGAEGKEDTTYYAVVYFEAYNDEAWYAQAYSLTVNEQFETWFEEQKKEMPVVYNEKALSKISTIVLNTTHSADDGHNH